MLTAIRWTDNKKVFARDSERSDSPYHCQKCKTEVVLHKGRIKAHHFKHKPPISCSLGTGETELHLKAKIEISDALRLEPNVTDVEVEKDFVISIADVYACISGIPVAIEIQRSALSVNDIILRTQNYHRLGVSVLWVGIPSTDISTDKYSPKAWEAWCHAAYFGRVYYWVGGQVIKPVHFDEFLLYVEPTSWYQDGSERNGGGYHKVSRRWKAPKAGVSMLLAHHFKQRVRNHWAAGKVSVPACTLYLDSQQKWWD